MWIMLYKFVINYKGCYIALNRLLDRLLDRLVIWIAVHLYKLLI